ncbi:MAG: methyltransferase family protein [Terriglobales bacterium]
MLIRNAILACWIIFIVYWTVSVKQTKAVRKRQSRWEEWSWRGPLCLGCLLLIFARFVPPPDAGLVPATWTWAGVGVVLTVVGLAGAIWARRALGGNWSSAVSAKQGHELVQDGPYRWVRNPIYTGLTLMFLGTALVVGRRSSMLALLLVVIAYWIKLRQEERVMHREFPEAYPAYRRRVKALVPFVF